MMKFGLARALAALGMVFTLGFGCAGPKSPPRFEEDAGGVYFPPVPADKYGINLDSDPRDAHVSCYDLKEGRDIVSEDEDLRTPTQLIMLRPSDYRVTVTLPGHMPASRDVMEGELVLGDAVMVELVLPPMPAATYTVTVNSAKSGPVFMDGAVTGKTTPATLADVPEGEHVFDVRLEGHLSIPQTVTVVSDVSVSVPLEWDVNGNWNCDRRPELREAVMSVFDNTFWVRGLGAGVPMTVEGDQLGLPDMGDGVSINGSITNNGRVASWTLTGPGGSIEQHCTR